MIRSMNETRTRPNFHHHNNIYSEVNVSVNGTRDWLVRKQ